MTGGDAAFVDRHHAPLTAYVRALVGSQPIAADIVQETWLRAIPSLRDGTVENARAFLYRIARNLVADDRRNRFSRRIIFIETEPPPHIADPAPLPDRALLDVEALARLQEALGELSQRSLQVLMLRRLEGLSAAEIGDRLGISRQMVTRYLSQEIGRSRSRQRDRLSKGLPAGDGTLVHPKVDQGRSRAMDRSARGRRVGRRRHGASFPLVICRSAARPSVRTRRSAMGSARRTACRPFRGTVGVFGPSD